MIVAEQRQVRFAFNEYQGGMMPVIDGFGNNRHATKALQEVAASLGYSIEEYLTHMSWQRGRLVKRFQRVLAEIASHTSKE